MASSSYLHVHIPGRGQLTLSLPGGIARALRDGRLPAESEVWDGSASQWLPLDRHPAILPLLPAPPGPPEPVEMPAEPQGTTREWVTQGGLPLIVADDWQIHMSEFSRMVERSSEAEERRRVARNSTGLRRSSGAVVVAAGDDSDRARHHRFRPGRLGVILGGALFLAALGAGTVQWYLTPGAAPGAGGPSLSRTESGARAGEIDTLGFESGGAVVVVPPNPLTDLEANLESDLRIAEVLIWQPALDFASLEQVLRSSRKVSALRNALSLYRLGAWRSVDGPARETDLRLESFAEAAVVDSALQSLQDALDLLAASTGRYRVSGDYLVFPEPGIAVRYDSLARRAAALIVQPLETDSFPTIRAPRRVVQRLVASLPAAVIAAPQH